MEAIAYCHARRVCHRDLKLKNLMLSTAGDEAEVKLIDFGFCKIFNSLDGMYAILGSPYYVAPEILKTKAPPPRPPGAAARATARRPTCGASASSRT